MVAEKREIYRDPRFESVDHVERHAGIISSVLESLPDEELPSVIYIRGNNHSLEYARTLVSGSEVVKRRGVEVRVLCNGNRQCFEGEKFEIYDLDLGCWVDRESGVK